MVRRKQLINEIANKVFEHLLLEVGEGVEPYKFVVSEDDPRMMQMQFTIPSDEDDGKPVYMIVHFDITLGTRADVLFKSIIGMIEDLNRNQVYKTMSTVVACIKYFLQKRPDIQFLTYSPTDERRRKLYSVYVRKLLRTTNLGEHFEELDGGEGLVRKLNSALGMSLRDLLYKQGAKNLEGANLKGFFLKKAKLQGANLKGADLTYANLDQAHLERADLTGVKNLETCEGLDTVEYDEHTIWPDGFDIHKYQKK